MGFQTPEAYYSQRRSELLPFVPAEARRFLDVGCGEGAFAQALKGRPGAEVWGIELDPGAAARARDRLDRVLEGDAGQAAEFLPDGFFDCITFLDCLEHLVDPWRVVRQLRPKLAAGGTVVCSIPNVRYLPVLARLLLAKQWKYEDSGVLDRTHLRFFTCRTIPAFFAECGFEVLKLEGINANPSWKFGLANLASLGRLGDTRFLQFACVARPLG